jgi:hypothetical protein
MIDDCIVLHNDLTIEDVGVLLIKEREKSLFSLTITGGCT